MKQRNYRQFFARLLDLADSYSLFGDVGTSIFFKQLYEFNYESTYSRWKRINENEALSFVDSYQMAAMIIPSLAGAIEEYYHFIERYFS